MTNKEKEIVEELKKYIKNGRKEIGSMVLLIDAYLMTIFERDTFNVLSLEIPDLEKKEFSQIEILRISTCVDLIEKFIYNK